MDIAGTALRRIAWSGLVLCLAAAVTASILLAPARAAALRVGRDHADNGFSFSYDAPKGKITQAASSVVFHRGESDQVTFLTNVRTQRHAPSGRRLLGTIGLNLEGKRSVVYNGVFKLRFKKAGKTVLVKKRRARIVLRPRFGMQRATIRFKGDLPTGDYELVGRFIRKTR